MKAVNVTKDAVQEILRTVRNLELLLEAVALIYVSAYALSEGHINPLGDDTLRAFGLLIVLRGAYEFIRFIRSAKPEA